MLHRLLIWIREHKLATVLILILAVVIIKDRLPTYIPFTVPSMQGSGYPTSQDMYMQAPLEGPEYMQPGSYGMTKTVPPEIGGGGVGNTSMPRMVSKEAYLGMVVKDLSLAFTAMQDIAQRAGGFVVSTHINDPSGNGSANLTVRVPSASLKDVVAAYRALGVKVVSETVSGADITAQYQDITEQLRMLEETKVKFEAMLKSSTDVQDTLSVLREIQGLQQQIDALKGQEKYLTESAKYSLLTVSMSKDEYELPYAPEEPWSAANVFKRAVRELVRTIRTLTEKVVWVGVYAVLWVPATIILFVLYRRFLRRMI